MSFEPGEIYPVDLQPKWNQHPLDEELPLLLQSTHYFTASHLTQHPEVEIS